MTIRRLIFALAAGVVIFLGGTLVALLLLHVKPRRYLPADTSFPTTIRDAEALENGAARQLSMVRPNAQPGEAYKSEPWTVAISEMHANAWLASRLPQWLGSRGTSLPAGVSNPCVAFVEGAAGAYATVDTAVGHIVITQPMRISFQDQSLKIDFGMSNAGAMTLPGLNSEILTALSEKLKDRHLGEVHEGSLVVPIPVLKLDDGRNIELLDVRCRPGTLEITCRTVAAPKRNAR